MALESAGVRRLTVTALVLVLLGGTTAAFALTQVLKLERSPVTAPKFDRLFAPTCGCDNATATLALKLRKADSVDAVMVDSDAQPVRTLADGLDRPKGRVTFEWDGRNDAGELVRDGRYRLRVHLARQGRTIVLPIPVEVDTKPPVVALVRIRPSTFSPDGDGRRDKAMVVYRAREAVRLLFVVDGRVRSRTRLRGAGRTRVWWYGKPRGRALAAGVYAVSLQAVDRAGNRSAPSEALPVRIRYIELAPERLRARGRTLRFRVSTDARPFRWSLLRASGRRVAARGLGERPLVVVDLPPAVGPGRYVLRVSANGRRDEARVIVPRPRR